MTHPANKQFGDRFLVALEALNNLSLRELQIAFIYAQQKLEYEREKLLAEKEFEK